MSDRVWFITGANSGFGRHVAERVLAGGGRVVATARRPEELRDLVEGCGGDRVLAARLDVTAAGEAEAAVAAALDAVGRVDVLMNNAGYGGFGAIEEVAEEEVRRQFEVNLFGAVRVTRAALPAMRRQRSGHVLNLSSLAGQHARAGYGYYAATKFVLEAVSESLAQEVAPLGIRVTIVEPSGFRTDFNGRSLRVPERRIDDYAPTAGAFLDDALALDGRQPGDPARAAAAMVEVVERDDPPLRLPLGRDAVRLIREKLESVRRDVDAGERVAVEAEFPGTGAA